MEKLLPCPRCNTPASPASGPFVFANKPQTYWYAVCCETNDCMENTPEFSGKSEAEAADAWNKYVEAYNSRLAEAAPEMLELLMEARDDMCVLPDAGEIIEAIDELKKRVLG